MLSGTTRGNPQPLDLLSRVLGVEPRYMLGQSSATEQNPNIQRFLPTFRDELEVQVERVCFGTGAEGMTQASYS